MTILNTEVFNPSVGTSIFVMCLIGAFIFLIVGGLIFFSSDDGTIAVIMGSIIAGIIVVIMLVSGLIDYNERHLEKTIECTISDEVTFKEIYDKYEIKDKRGDIYILVEKSNEGDE